MKKSDSSELAKPLLDIFRCKVCVRVTIVAFLAIIVVELIVLVPSCAKFVDDWKTSKKNLIFSAIQTISLMNTAINTEKDLSRSIGLIADSKDIRGWRVINTLTKEKISHTEDGYTFFNKAEEGSFFSIFENKEYFDVLLDSKVLSIPYDVYLKVDGSGLQDALLYYIVRISGLVIVISAFVTCAVFFALKFFVFSPVLTLRNHFNAVTGDLGNAQNYLINLNADGEIGELYFGFNALLKHIKESFNKINEFNNSLQKEIKEKKLIENELRHSKKNLESVAAYDDLTGLPNRRIALAKLSYEIQYAQESKITGALFFVDLDNFKEVNDTLGHANGDELLVQAAKKMVSIIRDSTGSVNDENVKFLDFNKEKRRVGCPNKNDLVARIGGDEFVIILCDISKSDASAIAGRIQKTFAKPFVLSGGEVFSTTSIGVTIFPADSHEPSECMSRADMALYEAKDSGKNCYRFFNSEMVTNNDYRSQLTQQLYHAIDNNELYLNYQPIISLKSGNVVSVEALLRWNNVKFGSIGPDTFIPIAEMVGLVIPIGYWVLSNAFKQCKKLNLQQSPVGMAINISPKQFKSKKIVSYVKSLLQENELSPDLIEFEITESMLIEEESDEAKNIQALSELGIKFSIDDFGTGFSSLSYLDRFPINTLKIDRSFVNNIIDTVNDAPLVRTIIDMGKNFQLEIIAEGVETKEQVDFLLKNNCDQVQGYYFSKPVLFDDLLSLLEIKNNNWLD